MTGRCDVLEDMRLFTKAAVSSGEGIINFHDWVTSLTEVQRSGYIHTSKHDSIGPMLEITLLLLSVAT